MLIFIIIINFPMTADLENIKNTGENIENNSDYIRALEMTVDVLQKEVARLKSQLKNTSISNTDNDNSLFFILMDNINSKNKIKDIIDLINEQCVDHHDVVDSSFFLVNDNSEIEIIEHNLSSESLKPKLNSFREQGIVDWIFETGKASVVPNFNNETNDPVKSFIILPITLIPDIRFVFVASSGKNVNDNNIQNNNELKTLLNRAACGIMMLMQKEDINSCKTRLNNIDLEIINYSRKAGLGNIFETFFRQSELYEKSIKAHRVLLDAGLGDEDRRNRIINIETEKLSKVNKLYTDLIRLSIKYKNTTNLELFIKRLKPILDIISTRLGIRLNFSSSIIGEASKCNPAELFQIILDMFAFLAERLQEAEAVSVNFFMKDPDMMLVSMSDNNRFASDVDKSIFQPGYRRPGKGLYHIEKLVQNLGGRIELINNENRGITFKIFLPVYNEDDNGN